MTIERNPRNSIYMTNFSIGGFDAVAAEWNLKTRKKKKKKYTEANEWKPELMCVQLVYGRWDKNSIRAMEWCCHLSFGFLCR